MFWCCLVHFLPSHKADLFSEVLKGNSVKCPESINSAESNMAALGQLQIFSELGPLKACLFPPARVIATPKTAPGRKCEMWNRKHKAHEKRRCSLSRVSGDVRGYRKRWPQRIMLQPLQQRPGHLMRLFTWMFSHLWLVWYASKYIPVRPVLEFGLFCLALNNPSPQKKNK